MVLLAMLIFISLRWMGHSVITKPKYGAGVALKALIEGWKNLPKSWTGEDPCGSRWEGITCNNYSRIITM